MRKQYIHIELVCSQIQYVKGNKFKYEKVVNLLR